MKIEDLYRPLLVTFILVIGVNLVLRLYHFDAIFEASNEKSLISFGLFIFQEILLLAPLYFFMRHYPLDSETLGFRKVGFWKTFFFMLQAFGFLLLFGIFYFYVIGENNVPGFLPQKSYVPLFGGFTNFDFYLSFLALVLLAPLAEEIVFRSFILQAAVQKWGPFIGNILTALFFVVVHFQFGSFFLLLVPSLIFNWLFLKSRSVVPGIIFHILNNSLAFVLQWFFFAGKFSF